MSDKELWQGLYENNGVNKRNQNAKEYYKEFGQLDGTLIDFINSFGSDAISEWADNRENFGNLEINLINEGGVNIHLIETISKACESKLTELNSELSERHIEILIKNKNLEMNTYNLGLIAEKSKKLIEKFVILNLSDFLKFVDNNEDVDNLYMSSAVYPLIASNITNIDEKHFLIDKYKFQIRLSYFLEEYKKAKEVYDKKLQDGTEFSEIQKLFNEMEEYRKVIELVAKNQIDISELPEIIKSYYGIAKEILIELIAKYKGELSFKELDLPENIVIDLLRSYKARDIFEGEDIVRMLIFLFQEEKTLSEYLNDEEILDEVLNINQELISFKDSDKSIIKKGDDGNYYQVTYDQVLRDGTHYMLARNINEYDQNLLVINNEDGNKNTFNISLKEKGIEQLKMLI